MKNVDSFTLQLEILEDELSSVYDSYRYAQREFLRKELLVKSYEKEIEILSTRIETIREKLKSNILEV